MPEPEAELRRPERRDALGDDVRAAVRDARELGPMVPAAAAPELLSLVRALPVAIDAARLREGTPLSLSFGGSLDVELRLGGGGLAVLLRPEARLARACDAELPRLVAALEARGIVVGRASVRARSSAQAERQASR